MPHVDSNPITVHPSGELHLEVLETMVRHLSRATQMSDDIVIDLRDVTYLDSTAVDVLAHAMARGASVVVEDAPADVVRVIATSGLLEPAF